MSSGKREAVAAAKWWADHLYSGARTGNPDGEAFTLLGSGVLPELTAEQVEAFRAELEEAILALIVGGAGTFWQEAVATGEPRRGAAFRRIDVDYSLPPILGEALRAAGIPLRTGVLPLKTCMWINPGQVTVSHGHKAPEVEIPLPIGQALHDAQQGEAVDFLLHEE